MAVEVATSIRKKASEKGVIKAERLAREIFGLVRQYRRIPADEAPCEAHGCPNCEGPHLYRMVTAIERKAPIVFILPAFPGKSPNPAKVLGPRPDMAERQSLAFLSALCRRIEKLYPPGARMVLCSDGRVFNDVVGIADSDITTYQKDLAAIVEDLQAEPLTTFNLDDLFAERDFNAMRAHLMQEYGEPMEVVEGEVRQREDALRMYRGITRFLFEDALRPNMTTSKTALQKECRRRAYEVIQRSRAWDRILAEQFPHAVRLSIHPQICGSRKIGIHLMETQRGAHAEWLTAWHSVAVEIDGRFRLMKRAEIEKLGGELVSFEGRPSHYRLRSK